VLEDVECGYGWGYELNPHFRGVGPSRVSIFPICYDCAFFSSFFFNKVPELPYVADPNGSLVGYAEEDVVRSASRKEVGGFISFLLFSIDLQLSVLDDERRPFLYRRL
jgi:hypothetical protein